MIAGWCLFCRVRLMLSTVCSAIVHFDQNGCKSRFSPFFLFIVLGDRHITFNRQRFWGTENWQKKRIGKGCDFPGTEGRLLSISPFEIRTQRSVPDFTNAQQYLTYHLQLSRPDSKTTVKYIWHEYYCTTVTI